MTSQLSRQQLRKKCRTFTGRNNSLNLGLKAFSMLRRAESVNFSADFFLEEVFKQNFPAFGAFGNFFTCIISFQKSLFCWRNFVFINKHFPAFFVVNILIHLTALNALPFSLRRRWLSFNYTGFF